MTRGGRGLNRSRGGSAVPPPSPPTFPLPAFPSHPCFSFHHHALSQPLPSSLPHLLLFKGDLNCKYFFLFDLGLQTQLRGKNGEERPFSDALRMAPQTNRACGPDPAWAGGEGFLRAATGSVLGMVPGPQSSKGPRKMFKARKTIYLASK